VFIVLSVYFVIDSVRKLLDTPSYTGWEDEGEAELVWTQRWRRKNPSRTRNRIPAVKPAASHITDKNSDAFKI